MISFLERLSVREAELPHGKGCGRRIVGFPWGRQCQIDHQVLAKPATHFFLPLVSAGEQSVGPRNSISYKSDIVSHFAETVIYIKCSRAAAAVAANTAFRGEQRVAG